MSDEIFEKSTGPGNNPQIAISPLAIAEDEAEVWDEVELSEAELGGLLALDFEEPPLLVVDTDPDRAIARQKEMMEACFGGIGEETKPEKRMGLAVQQLDIENRHALRLLLIYEDADALVAHLHRCLADPAYGYGERGDQGRTVAQAMQAMAADSGDGSLDDIARNWLAAHHDFQQRVLAEGRPMTFLSLFDYADLDSFTPLLRRTESGWRLGVEGEGQYRDFAGALETVWPKLCDAYVQWSEADNQAWLESVKRAMVRYLPDTILRAARADRLRRLHEEIEVTAAGVRLATISEPEEWPRTVTMHDAEGSPQLALTRLSGHGFYEVSWEGGLRLRRFELSGTTTRNRVPFEHIELALALAETLGSQYQLVAPPVTMVEVEAAYLRRMKASGAVLGYPDPELEIPQAIKGAAVATYRVDDVTVTMLGGDEADFGYVTAAGEADEAVLLRFNPQRGLLLAMPVRRGRPQPTSLLMTTPLTELDLSGGETRRALCAWGAWLLWATILAPKRRKKRGGRDDEE